MLLAGETTTGASTVFFAGFIAQGFCAPGSMLSLSRHRLPLTSWRPSSAGSSKSTRIAIVAAGVSTLDTVAKLPQGCKTAETAGLSPRQGGDGFAVRWGGAAVSGSVNQTGRNAEGYSKSVYEQ